MVVAGLISGASSVYGDYDAVVLIYSSNMTLLSAKVIGSTGCDSASAVALPFVLLAAPVAPAA